MKFIKFLPDGTICEEVLEKGSHWVDVALNEGTNLKEIGADSFDLLELVTALEEEFSMTFPDEAVGTISTVGQVVDAIAAAQ